MTSNACECPATRAPAIEADAERIDFLRTVLEKMSADGSHGDRRREYRIAMLRAVDNGTTDQLEAMYSLLGEYGVTRVCDDFTAILCDMRAVWSFLDTGAKTGFLANA